MGDVQADYLKVRQGNWRAHKVACYLSKYVTKMLISSERFNKRRYSVAKSVLAERQHLKLEAGNLTEAFSEVCRRFGIRVSGLLAQRGCLFFFPGDDGLWFQVPPAKYQLFKICEDPPF